jgi:peptidyl-prolyl cis-trans isomerase D
MLQFFRNLFSSKIGVAIVLGIVGIIGLSFALADVSGSSTFGGVAGGDRVASVGSKRIGTGELSRRITATMESARQQNPQLTMKKFLAEGGLDGVLTDLINRVTLRAWGEDNGFAPSDRLIDSELNQIAAFKGADGKFSKDLFVQLIGQRGMTEAQAREEVAQSISAKLMLTPADLAATMPRDAALRYAGILTETRTGGIGLLPSAAFVPATPPSDREVTEWYAGHRNDYLRPERRTIRYATFGDAALGTIAAPTDKEVADRYTADHDKYAASEKRKITQLVLPTEAAARAVLAELRGGKSLEAAAGAKGLSAATLGSLTREQLTGQSSTAVAEVTFSAGSGTIAGPVKSGLGWHLMRVDAIEGKPARSLDQVRGEITKELTEVKRREALTNFSAEIEDEFDNGSALGDVARKLGLTLNVTQPLLANGIVYGKDSENAPGELAPVLPTAFAMEGEGQPQIAEIVPGKTFMVFDVGSMVEAAPAPLAEIKPQVIQDIQLSKGAVAAKAAAQKVEALLKKGTDMAVAMASLGATLPPVDRVSMTRLELQRYGQRVPPPLQVFFGMARGTTKLMGAPRNRGWYVLRLEGILPGKIDANDPRLAGLVKELSDASGKEYTDQLIAAMAADVGVERNDAAIRAVRTSLLGGN